MQKPEKSTALLQRPNLKDLWAQIQPTAKLALLCIATAILLVGAHQLTYLDTTGVLTDNLRNGCVEIFGEGDYEMLTPPAPEGVTSVIVDRANKTCALEISANGYAKNGLHVLVGIKDDGSVAGVHVLSLTETPGLGTKVKDASFLSQFTGKNDPDITVEAITGATFSSKGMGKAVSLALQVYQDEKEAIFSE